MTFTDPIGDLLTRMRNAQHARRTECRAPWSRIKEELCEVLKREGMIADVAVEGDIPTKELVVSFVEGRAPLLLKRVSSPGQRRYSSASTLKPVLHGFGIAVLTTSAGLLTDTEAREKKVGGEILCTVA